MCKTGNLIDSSLHVITISRDLPLKWRDKAVFPPFRMSNILQKQERITSVQNSSTKANWIPSSGFGCKASGGRHYHKAVYFKQV